mmetsp:Transcript_10519/g.32707  ORF Transcript_10519/g.32707 Transcript_10519/m.32707 type:complete len:997 (-) Transcript_10519:194-3184(-)
MGIFKGTPKKSATAASSSSSKASPAQAGKEVSPQRQQASPQDSPAPSSAAAVPLAPLPENKEPAFLSDDGLRELLTRKLKDQQGSIYTESTQASSKYTDLRYAKFTIAGFPGVKHAVFIPDNLKLSPPVLQQVCSAIDKEMPCMLLQGVSSLCHPAKMSTPQLRKCRGLRQLMSDSKSSLRMPGGEDPEAGGCCCKPRTDGDANELQVNDAELSNKELIKVANHVLEKKVASTISSVATAACRTNVWTFTGPNLSNFEIFLQQGLETGETEIFRMVAAHMQDKAYMESEMSRSLMKCLFDSSQAMSADVVERATPVPLQGDLWNPAKNTAHEEFCREGFEYWSFESLEDETAVGHPIIQWPWPHADLYFLFYREDANEGGPTSDADWEFVTKKRLDRDAIPFSPEVLAPVGHVFIGGCQAQMKKKLLQAMRHGSPVILLDNTPNVPKQMALVVKDVQKVWERAPIINCRPFLSETAQLSNNPTSAELLEAMLPSKIMNHLEEEFDNSGMEEAEKLTLSDIYGLMDLVKRRPQTFKDTVCVVDPLHSTPDRIMTQLVSVMNSYNSSTREISTTSIHRSLVMKAWRQHRKMARRAAQLRDRALALLACIALVMVLSTTLAVAMVFLRLQKAKVQEIMYNVSAPVLYEEIEISFTMTDELGFLKISLLVLPILAGLLTTLQSHYQVSQKWASVHMAATQLVSEIYQFLGNVGPYNNPSSSMNQTRFMKRQQDMIKHLSMCGVHEDDLMEGSDSSDDGFPQDYEVLEAHINQYLYGIQPTSCFYRKLQDCMAALGACGPPCAWTALLMDGQECKDPAAPLTAEAYMETRILPLRKHYSEWVRTLSSVNKTLNVLLVICLSVGSGLGASGFSLWIPVTLGLATFVTTLSHALAPSEILTAVNNAMTTLHNLDLRWQGIRENRSEATKSHLILTTEKISCAVATTFSGASLMPEEIDDDIFDDGPLLHVPRVGEKRREPHSRPISVPVTPYSGRSGTTTPLG